MSNYTFDHLEALVVSLTVVDRPKNRAKWLAKGFSKMNRGRLVDYWRARLSKQDPRDLMMYAEILEAYKVAMVRRERVAERIKSQQIEKQAALDSLRNAAPEKNTQPNATQMAKTVVVAAAKWAVSGFSAASEEEITKRKSICAECEHWSAGAFKQTGRCNKCGCSTWAKIRMATESCPEGKWGEEK
jgi:hypothetical protein